MRKGGYVYTYFVNSWRDAPKRGDSYGIYETEEEAVAVARDAIRNLTDPDVRFIDVNIDRYSVKGGGGGSYDHIRFFPDGRVDGTIHETRRCEQLTLF